MLVTFQLQSTTILSRLSYPIWASYLLIFNYDAHEMSRFEDSNKHARNKWPGNEQRMIPEWWLRVRVQYVEHTCTQKLPEFSILWEQFTFLIIIFFSIDSCSPINPRTLPFQTEVWEATRTSLLRIKVWLKTSYLSVPEGVRFLKIKMKQCWFLVNQLKLSAW